MNQQLKYISQFPLHVTCVADLVLHLNTINSISMMAVHYKLPCYTTLCLLHFALFKCSLQHFVNSFNLVQLSEILHNKNENPQPSILQKRLHNSVSVQVFINEVYNTLPLGTYTRVSYYI
jgi:hypothetical protein